MDEQERQQAAARLVTQMDQAQASFGGIGTALGKMYGGMVQAKVPRHVAGKVLVDVAREWAAGTFGKGNGGKR